jgi:hypothetical protein
LSSSETDPAEDTKVEKAPKDSVKAQQVLPVYTKGKCDP